MEKIVCILSEGTNGGTGVLGVKIAKWCFANGLHCAYCSVNNTNYSNSEELLKYNTELIFDNDRTFMVQFQQIIKRNVGSKIILLSYTWLNHYLGSLLAKEFPEIVRNILYQVGPDGSSYTKTRSKGIKRFLQKRINKSVFMPNIKRLIQRDDFYVMDEQCRNIASSNLDFDIPTSRVLHLPYEVTPYEKINLSIKRPDRFLICTALRLTFPFKGYVFGLINFVLDLLKKGYQIDLDIIGSGDEGREVLENKIKTLPQWSQTHVHLYGSMPYLDMKKRIAEASLYIGMGTTIFDAVDSLTLAIPVAFDTYNLEGKGVFSDNPDACAIDPATGSLEFISEKTKEIYNMSKEDYDAAVIQQYLLLRKEYNLQFFMSKIVDDWKKKDTSSTFLFKMYCAMILKKHIHQTNLI